ncbi:hypothetical protein BDB01DRAFT_770269 [Pilobolus umbonatus]|nr:hypothetical protein BDB01DRAFT_770269 [Pilobolus umbonatus]
MTSHETRSSHTTRTKSSSSELNDLKKLKSKYSATLPTLKVLFSDWSDDDLLFVLDEANGDLDLTIDRISEGHANQWGEVKTKKSKKEAQKAKAASAILSTSHQQSTITPYRDTKTTQPRSYNDRGNRPGKVPVSSTSTRSRSTKSSSAASWDNQPKINSNQEISAGSWASIASKHQQEQSQDDSWNTTNESTDDWAPISTPNPSEDSHEQPKTWASLLKSKPKPEPEATIAAEIETNNENNHNNVHSNSSNTETSQSEWDTAPDEWKASSEPVLDEWSMPVSNEQVTIESTTIVTELDSSDRLVEDEREEEEVKPILGRLHNQEEPVVLPNSSTIASLDVKFGTLSVGDETGDAEEVQESITSVEIVTQPAANTTTTSTITTSAPIDVISTTTEPNPSIASSSYLKQQEPAFGSSTIQAPSQPQQTTSTQSNNPPSQPAPTQSTSQPITQQSSQHQPQQPPAQQQAAQPAQPAQPQQQFGVDHLTSAYSSYLPNQPPTGISGFGMSPMGALPDYGIYGTEAQRAAAMGYYDPTAFTHSPSVTTASTYQARDKFSQDTSHTQGLSQTQSIPQQQMYPTNVPYYQYYYMPNQFNAYQQSSYGQPYKSMYPNMYQHSAKPGTTAASPYGATASPYGQHSQLYNQSVGSGYDDLQQLSMGLNDYQKSMYGGTASSTTSGSQPQLQGFLGNITAQQGAQSTQPAVAQQQSQQQQGQKPEMNARGAAGSTSLPQQQQTQQHIPQQHTPQHQAYGGNYFGQPQMFSYQQYHHHQFQQQMPHQAQPQQPTRQQYWNQ